MYITLSEKIQSQSTDSQKILPGRSAIEDRGWRRRVVIEKVGAASSVVWNPWAEKAAAMADLGDLTKWRTLSKRLSRKAKNRNEIAHFSLVTSVSIPGKRRE